MVIASLDQHRSSFLWVTPFSYWVTPTLNFIRAQHSTEIILRELENQTVNAGANHR